MKFRAHDTFFIRKGWLSKGMRNVIADKDVFITKDKDRNPLDVLGIGSNMVKAYASQHTLYGLDIVAPEVEGVKKTFSWDDLRQGNLPDPPEKR